MLLIWICIVSLEGWFSGLALEDYIFTLFGQEETWDATWILSLHLTPDKLSLCRTWFTLWVFLFLQAKTLGLHSPSWRNYTWFQPGCWRIEPGTASAAIVGYYPSPMNKTPCLWFRLLLYGWSLVMAVGKAWQGDGFCFFSSRLLLPGLAPLWDLPQQHRQAAEPTLAWRIVLC